MLLVLGAITLLSVSETTVTTAPSSRAGRSNATVDTPLALQASSSLSWLKRP